MKNTLYACYDFKKCPITFDICNFLCLAEAHRLQHGFNSIHLVTIPGPHQGFRDAGVVSDNAKEWRLRKVINDCAWLLPSCRQVTNFYSRDEARLFLARMGACMFPEGYDVEHAPIPKYSWKHVNEASNNYVDLQHLSAGSEARRIINEWLGKNAGDKKIVTVTLRQTEYEVIRNSQVNEWYSFLSAISHKYYFPIVIPDFDFALDDQHALPDGIAHFPDVVWDVELRTALYELAYLNFFINNGTTTLGYFNRNVNFVIMKWVVDSVRVTSRSFLVDEMGFEENETPKFFGKFQKLCWEVDDLNNIQREFASMVEIIENETHGHFDADWYANEYSLEGFEDAFVHYESVGMRMGYCPNRDFDERQYRQDNPSVERDIADGVLKSGFEDYIRSKYPRP